MAVKKKYYVVWEGKSPGIYASWAACEAMIKGVANARFKSFASRAEAEAAYRADPPAMQTARTGSSTPQSQIRWESIAVDAACSGNPGNMEYRGVDTKTGKELFRQGPFREGTNNVGEFLALVHGLAWLKSKGLGTMPIYSDSQNALLWIKKKKANTKLEATAANRPIFDLLERAEQWLHQNTYQNPLLKWETEQWGEIPADFGRK